MSLSDGWEDFFLGYHFPFESIRFSVGNFKLKSWNMIKGSTDRHPLSHLEPIMVMNSPQRSGSTGKRSVVSRESEEVYRSPDDQLRVMRLFRKFVTKAGVLVEYTHRACKSVFDEEDSKCQVPEDHAVLGCKFGRDGLAENGIELMGIEPISEQTGEKEVVNVVGMYASFLWATEQSHD